MDDFAGVVRREDVRGLEIDKVVVAEAFRVGDLVRGVVVSAGCFPFRQTDTGTTSVTEGGVVGEVMADGAVGADFVGRPVFLLSQYGAE